MTDRLGTVGEAPPSLSAGELEIPTWASGDALEDLARKKLAQATFDSIAGGAGDELTVRANRNAFDRLYLRPRTFVDVANRTTRVSVLGSSLAAPLYVNPMGGQQRVHPLGEAGSAVGAAQVGVGFMLGVASSISMEEVAARAGEARWFQFYFSTRDRGAIVDLVDRAAAAGFKALCVTGDVPVITSRRRELWHEAEGRIPPSTHVVASDPGVRASQTWKDVEWLRQATALPVLVKGVMTGEDARIAIDCGVSGVVVSNHGGRISDHLQASIDALPEVVDAVGGRAAVFFDGGVRRPTDVAIAAALGADAIGIGRPVWWALAYGGSAGVASLLRQFVVGLNQTLALVGARSITDLHPSQVGRRAAL
jgi:4-hydroxymandelate oxidase